MSVGSFLLGALFIGGLAWIAGFASGLVHAERECLDRMPEPCSSTYMGTPCELTVNHQGVHRGRDNRGVMHHWPRRFYA